jgi:hypothetical protein
MFLPFHLSFCLGQKKRPQQPFTVAAGASFANFLQLWRTPADNRPNKETNIKKQPKKGIANETVRYIDVHLDTLVHPEPPQLFPKYIR